MAADKFPHTHTHTHTHTLTHSQTHTRAPEEWENGAVVKPALFAVRQRCNKKKEDNRICTG